MHGLLTAFIAYLVALFLVALYANYRTKSMTDFAIGGRSISSPVAALSAGASDMSGWLLLGLPGAIYLSGLVELWIVIGLVVGALLNWSFVAKRLRVASVVWGDATSIPHVLRLRVAANGPLLEIVAAVAIVIFFTIYISAGFIAGAKLFESVFNLDYAWALLLGAFIVLCYTALGGFLAVSWTDTFQALLMMLVLVIVPILAFSVGSPNVNVNATTPPVWDAGAYGVLSVIGLLAWGLGYFGQPHILKRFMALRSPDDARAARTIGMSWMVISCIGAVAVAYAGLHLLPRIEDEETILIKLSEVLLNPWIAGIVIAAIMAAAMSTVDSQLMVITTSIVNSRWLNDRAALFVNRIGVIAVGTIAVLLALDPDSKIFGTVSLAWAGIGASIGPCVLFSLFYRKTTGPALIAGILVAIVVVPIWNEILSGGIFDIYALLPAFVLSSLVIWSVSYLWPNELAKKNFDEFIDRMDSGST
ncbi:MAG: sodium/proline symporter [Gammaproteobacteria bacterium]|nr:sodium/proline symporter [Gammaproteobacteria bacterium]MYF38146.1 sodium/proline symporter [Gammaproteobacteria bacterium]